MDINEINKIILHNKNTVNIVLPKDKLFNINTAKAKPVKSYGHFPKDLIEYNCIDEDLYKIDYLDYDYITTSGNVYLYYGNGMFYKRKIFKNNHNKYIYSGVTINDKPNQRRLHILLAQTFIPNPYDKYLKVVGHKNDKKDDNTLENLYWTNNQENTKDAALKGLNPQPFAENNENSFLVKVLDKNTYEIVGVYGSIRECDRCIENINMGMIARMCKNTKPYKPRSRKYIYQIATQEEFDANIELKSAHLIENLPVDKTPKVFYLCNDAIGYKKEFDNQVQASKICGISQAEISYMIKNGNTRNGWYCIYKKSIPYKDASSYQNFIDLNKPLQLTNIHTGEKMLFRTAKELREQFKLSGHDVKSYLKTGHIFMSEWIMDEVDIDSFEKSA